MSGLVLFRTPKQKQGDRKRSETLKRRKRTAGVLGLGALLGAGVALAFYKNKEYKKKLRVPYRDPTIMHPKVRRVPFYYTRSFNPGRDASGYRTIDI